MAEGRVRVLQPLIACKKITCRGVLLLWKTVVQKGIWEKGGGVMMALKKRGIGKTV